MSEITIQVGPRSYPFVCGDGEEAHIRKLAAMIDEKYEQLGAARGPQEAQNLLFAALFLADELAEARKVAKKSSENVEHEKAKSGGKTAELESRIETLTKSEARAREEIEALKMELAEMREAASHQHDLFGAPGLSEAVIERLEALATKAEATADALEAKGTAS
ncbi:cell division protein ZapA [Erythrobacter sp. THAF29]|uniref:cell division protein ZapA n=1 Tax=Erythrobacter sp. THAF29 TaxID=2587851 RepID=UPI0012683DA1|nr:cell division protein ZapA [Erythrobacter sp. THAF29]QFT77713.1 Cell division protein ZapA [Erythrobacter sp. THAF29]